MMLLERWLVAGVLGAGMLSGLSAGQSPARPVPQQTVQPDEGPPPDQAQQPDQATPLDQTIPPEPPPEPLPAVVVEEAAPAPAAPAPAVVVPHLSGTPEQQQLQKDAAQLLELVQELKLEVDKAGSNTLSLTAVRKADEVQRLTKSLKERMKVWSK